MYQDLPTPSAPPTYFDDPYSLELNNAIQKIINDNPKPSSDEKFSQKDLLLLIFKPVEVSKLKKNAEAKMAAQELYTRLQNEAMLRIATCYNQPPPPSYNDAIKAQPVAPVPLLIVVPPQATYHVYTCNEAAQTPPPEYAKACKAYTKNRDFCEERRQRWYGNSWNNHYYYGCPGSDILFVDAVCYGVEASIRGTILLARVGAITAGHALKGLAHLGTAAAGSPNFNCKSDTDCIAIVAVAGVVALALGLTVIVINQLIKAYQEDRDFHSLTRSSFVIAPTILASAASGYCAFAYVALATGLTVSTGGFALAVAIAVTATAIAAVLFCHMITNCMSSHRYRLTSEERGNLPNPESVQDQINYKVKMIDKCGITFFMSDKNSEVRKLRQEIYNLRTTGCEELPPTYDSAHANTA